MKENILRGSENIGENLIEISTNKATILLECGTPLCESEKTQETEKEVLVKEYDAILISHSHADHAGLLAQKVNAKSIYMGDGTFKILNYVGGIHSENLSKITTFESEKSFFISDIKITPHLCDHSAFDSFMLEIEGEESKILYTGDFRSNGRKSFQSLLERLPKNPDLLICEGTNLSRKSTICMSEYQLENKAREICNKYDTIFILQSTTNIDRLVSFYKASTKADCKFVMKTQNADICSLIGNLPNPKDYKKCFTCVQWKTDEEKIKTIKETYGRKFIGKNEIAKFKKVAIMVSSYSGDYIKNMLDLRKSKKAVLIYSMWGGYKGKEDMAKFLQKIKDVDIPIETLHTSGHASKESIDRLIETIKPQKISYVHCEKQ